VWRLRGAFLMRVHIEEICVRTLLQMMVMRGRIALALLAGQLGRALKVLSKQLIAFGETAEQYSWSSPLRARIAQGELEIVGCHSRGFRGPITAVRIHSVSESARHMVVLRLNWIASKNTFAEVWRAGTWSFGGTCEIAIDPIESPLHELPDGTLWFMWQNGGYGVIRFDQGARLRFAGSTETPREYTYF
jgi:hypothetical protein